MKRSILIAGCLALAAGGGAMLTGCGGSASATPGAITPDKFADGVHAVMMADRTVYAKHVVTRLKAQGAQVKPDEYWEEWTEDSGDPHMMPLPAQMFRMGASLVNDNPDSGFQYGLKSLWPLNPQHKPTDEEEVKALKYLADNPGENYSTESVDADGNKVFVKYYPDRAVAKACWECHNDHERRGEDYPTFEKDDVMGAVAVYVPLD
ncbi:MAG: DUF3365 domain-containing protein [Planctomycetota bacterium]